MAYSFTERAYDTDGVYTFGVGAVNVSGFNKPYHWFIVKLMI